MFARIRPHLTYANVMVTFLAFVVLGGASYAAVNLPKNSVKSRHIKNGQVKQADIAGNLKVAKAANAANADTLDDIDSSAFALSGSEGWTPIGLRHPGGNSCGYTPIDNGFNTAAYFRDRAGVVHLRGVIKAVDGFVAPCGGNDGILTVFAIPSGHRPVNRELFTISSNNKPGRIDVRSDGHIVLEPNYPTWADAKAWFSLDGISYRCGPSGENGCP